MNRYRSDMEYLVGCWIHEMPMGPHRGILSILRFHIGRTQAISRDELLDQVKRQFRISDRGMRNCINELRKDKRPICSMGGEGGGYYLPADPSELMDFCYHELHPRAMDLLDQEKALKTWAENAWGRYSPEKQLSMF
jgi:hypothetical protein